MSGGDRAAAMEAQGNSIIRRVPDRLMPGNVSSQLQPDKSGQLLHKVCLAARSARRAAPLSAHVHALCPVSYTHLDVYKRQGELSRYNNFLHIPSRKRTYLCIDACYYNIEIL